jgi:hypothetical protein
MQPFKGFSKHSPSELKELAYANEVVAVRALVGAAVATKPDPAVVAAGDVLLARAGVLDAALVGLTVPQAEYERALHARDLLLPGLRKALKTFKTHAASVWIADRPTYDAVFAAPPPIQRPRRRRAPKKAAPSPATAPAIA